MICRLVQWIKVVSTKMVNSVSKSNQNTALVLFFAVRNSNIIIQLEGTHRVQTSASGVRYTKAYPSKTCNKHSSATIQFVFTIGLLLLPTTTTTTTSATVQKWKGEERKSGKADPD